MRFRSDNVLNKKQETQNYGGYSKSTVAIFRHRQITTGKQLIALQSRVAPSFGLGVFLVSPSHNAMRTGELM